MAFDSTLFTRRRARFLDRAGVAVALIPSAPVVVRNHDVEHSYRQDSDFFYLTGFEEPDAVLLISSAHLEHRSVLFVRPRDPEREQWDGPRLGVERAVEELGVDAAFDVAELGAKLPGYLEGVRRFHVRLGRNERFDRFVFGALDAVRVRARRGITAPTELIDPQATLGELRLRKDGEEIATMRDAIAITAAAHRAAMRVARPGRYEYEVEAALLHAFRSHGSARVAYDSIVGSGANATVLHYRANDRRIEDGDLLLIDAGCEHGYYASDVTRTFPVSGKLTAPQREIYELVLRAQLAAIDAVRPGATLDDVHTTAVRVLAEGLIALSIIQGPLDDAIKEERYKRFYMHRTSHWLGMDVHDVGDYYVDGKARPLEPGFVLTVEPGLYFGANDDAAPEKYRGIGVRIEDDVLVTEGGRDNLTAAIPKDPKELEAILAER